MVERIVWIVNNFTVSAIVLQGCSIRVDHIPGPLKAFAPTTSSPSAVHKLKAANITTALTTTTKSTTTTGAKATETLADMQRGC